MSVTAEEREQLLRTLRKGGPMTMGGGLQRNVELCPKCSKAQKVIARLYKLLVKAEEALKQEEITNRRSMPVTMPPRDSP